MAHPTFGTPKTGAAAAGSALPCDDDPLDVLPDGGGKDPGVSAKYSRCDHVHELDATVITGYLAQIYALGVIDNPVTRNTLVGTTFNTFFQPDGAIDISETGSGAYALTLRKQSTTVPGLTLYSQRNTTKNNFALGGNVAGGVGWDYAIESVGGTANVYAAGEANLLSLVIPVTWYTPSLSSAGNPALTYIRWFLQNRNGGGATSQVYFNSDGVHWRQTFLPNSGGPYVLAAQQLAMNGVGGEPQTGSTHRHVSTAPSTAPDAPVNVAGYDVVLTDKNFGSAQAAGRFDVIASSLATPNQVVGSFAPLRRASVDIISAPIDFKTATTVTVVPQATGVELAPGLRFLPIAAFIEWTTVAALTVGPSVKLGNNGAHDNVAGVLAVANTVVTDDAVPFVMAIAPVIVDLTTTGVIAELTVNATATTATGRIHIIGMYI